ncbi:MAG TPA: CRISPR-associated protein Cas4 [Aggregatilinea sp.]|uniref:CRISPR-associated protein Cas4 n=1 Tax=Aggregatilinea sp. TaxID=2806333 RepID=UPI002CE199AF|nr:CRISPR-associated protein Cas4 [Aggregatilinea sp.]HML22993.1 CRISPR-associated protein Cas4 [Aggregatilinea sp.]
MTSMPDAEVLSTYLRINELKNYVYCPRISFYTLCMGIDRETGLSHMGIEAEAEVKARMRRRKHALHVVVEGQRHFDVTVFSPTYQIVGKVDEVVETTEGLYLIDYKDTEKDYGYWKLQIGAYHLCLSENSTLPVLACYIYSIPTQEYHPIRFTRRDEEKLRATLAELHAMMDEERCPPPAPQPGKCRTCQYSRFCNDVF